MSVSKIDNLIKQAADVTRETQDALNSKVAKKSVDDDVDELTERMRGVSSRKPAIAGFDSSLIPGVGPAPRAIDPDERDYGWSTRGDLREMEARIIAAVNANTTANEDLLDDMRALSKLALDAAAELEARDKQALADDYTDLVDSIREIALTDDE
jgi:hypothetical protein